MKRAEAEELKILCSLHFYFRACLRTVSTKKCTAKEYNRNRGLPKLEATQPLRRGYILIKLSIAKT